ncbi:polyamine transport protein PotG [Pseudomonas sp. BAY1663]|nr:polyamine transport protein PotG [Pseudomonas sp. BAY1663]
MIDCPQLERPIYVGHGISTRAEDKRVTYALRPEKLLMSLDKPVLELAGYNWVQGVVHDIAYLGGHSVYYIKLESGTLLQAFVANAERHVKWPTWEEQVYLHWLSDSGVVLQA